MSIMVVNCYLNGSGGSGGDPIGEADLYVPAGTVGSDLTDYTLCVQLAILPDSFWDNTNAGADLRFFSGATELPTDLIWCNTSTRRGVIWVKVPLIDADADTVISWTVDGVSSRPADGAANGKYAVWSDYEFVAIPYADFADRTGNNAAGTLTGTPTFGAPTGKWPGRAGGGAAILDGTKYYDVPVADISTFSGIISMGISFLHLDGTQDAILTYRDESSGATDDRISIADDNGTNIGGWDPANGWVYTGLNCDTDDWHHANLCYNAGTERKIAADHPRFFTIDSTVTDRSAQGYDMMTLGRDDNSNAARFNGYIGWCYLRPGYLSDDWIAFEQRMLNDVMVAEPGAVTRVQLGSNVDLALGDATNWTLTTVTVESTNGGRGAVTVTPAYGSYMLMCGSAATCTAVYSGSVSGYATEIDAGAAGLQFHFAIAKDVAASDTDNGKAQVRFLDGSSAEITSFTMTGTEPESPLGGWQEFKWGALIPPLTRTVEITFTGTRPTGTVCSVLFDVKLCDLLLF